MQSARTGGRITKGRGVRTWPGGEHREGKREKSHCTEGGEHAGLQDKAELKKHRKDALEAGVGETTRERRERGEEGA